jgi:hypothetical protein
MTFYYLPFTLLMQKIDEDLDEIKVTAGNYQRKLKIAVAEMETERVETMLPSEGENTEAIRDPGS